METSSPLAMHCPAPAPFGRRDIFTNLHVRLSPGKPRTGRGLGLGAAASGAGLLTIRGQLNQDHFGAVHGSSPAGSLAVDLCQNFTIGEDASPRFPTPRRALFTGTQKRGFFKRPLVPASLASTPSAASPSPSLASSSPVPIADLMDMTPVPVRKAPAAAARDVIPPSSPAFSSPADEMMLESPCPAPAPQPAVQEPARPLTSGLEKFPRRASLTRVKGYSYAAPSSRGHTDASQLPIFRFGDSPLPTAPAAPSSLSLSECFQESPPPPPPQPAPAPALAPAPAPAPILKLTLPQVQVQVQAAAPAEEINSPCANLGLGLGMGMGMGLGLGMGAGAGTGPIRTRASLVSASSAASSSTSSSRTGSPALGGIAQMRRQSSSFIRSRRQYRRSLSMFDNAGDLLKPKARDDHPAAATLQSRQSLQSLQPSLLPLSLQQPAMQSLQPSLLPSAMDTDSGYSGCGSGSDAAASTIHHPALPHFFAEGQGDAIPRIGRDTLLQVLDGAYDDRFDQKLLIDCRFEYEYAGGHISEAINYNDKDLLVAELFQRGGGPSSLSSPSSPAAAAVAAAAAAAPGRTLLVLHCEYSAHRAPLMGRHVRAEDRAANAEQYPRLSFPELYILDGGYSGFFGEHPGRCYPQAYVEMDAAEHAFACERAMGRLRQNQNRKGLHRAQTFAFGQDSSSSGGGGSSKPATASAASAASAVTTTTTTTTTTATTTTTTTTTTPQPVVGGPRSLFARFDRPVSRARAVDDSETATAAAGLFGTSSAGSSPSMMVGGSPILGLDRRHARRMASY